MKIITGSAKGKRLVSLEGDATRPTSERIKEAIFSSIQFDVDSRRVLDLFAGSGQMGLEALSRDAQSAMFIDSSMDAMQIVKTNAKATGFFDKCHYLVSDFRNFARKYSGREPYDLIFIDPPYALNCATEAVQRLLRAELIAKGALVVLELGTEEPNFTDAPYLDFDVQKLTHYGKKTTVAILFYRGKSEV